MKKVLYYLHAFLFAAISPLYVYISYPDRYIYVHPDSIWRLVLFSFLFSLCSAFLFFVVLRDHLSAGLISTCLVLGILYPRYPFISIIITILVASLLLTIVKKRFDLLQPCIASIFVSIIVVVYAGAEYAQVRQASAAYPARSLANPIEIKTPALRTSYKPDIYYIILDAYGGEKMLKELHEFDNSLFTNALRKRGFILPPASRSNYLRTIHSLGSSLNMQYLDSISDAMGTSPLWWPLRKTFANNETRKFVESQGYKTAIIASGWDFTTITDTDTYKQPFPIFLNDFEEFFISTTNLSLFQFLGKTGVSFPSYDTHRRILLYELEQLKSIPELESPKFTFVHIIAPHPPFVFDAKGKPINPDYPYTIIDNRYLITPPTKYEQGYLDQLSFINTQVLQVVDAILEKSAHPPIIIIQGDHGPGIFLDAQSAIPPCFDERFSILNAYYLPGLDPDAVPPDITPVNTFRMIFNEYFSANLELLPNHQYFSQPEAIHQFKDVTDRTDNACVFPN
jgi:hypothetical protein